MVKHLPDYHALPILLRTWLVVKYARWSSNEEVMLYIDYPLHDLYYFPERLYSIDISFAIICNNMQMA